MYCFVWFNYDAQLCRSNSFIRNHFLTHFFQQLYHGAGTIDNLSPSWTQVDPGAGGSSISTYSGAGTEGDLWDPPNQSMVTKRAGGYAF